jgi:hypothetical protein
LANNRVAMTPYAWTCLACAHDEPASATRCSRCGCNACATVAQVEAARTAHGADVAAPASGVAWREIPWLLVGTLAFAATGGALLVIAMSVAPNASVTAAGGLLLALAALCASSRRRAPPPPA